MSKIWIILCSWVSSCLEHSMCVRGISMQDAWIYPNSLWVSTQNIRSALKALTKKMRMKAEIRFGAKTIVTQCDVIVVWYSLRSPNNSIIHAHVSVYVFSQFMCYIGFTIKIKLFKHKRFKDEKFANKNTGLSRFKTFQIIRNLQFFCLTYFTLSSQLQQIYVRTP